MKYNSPFVILSSIIAIIFYSACNDPTVIGSDLLTGDQLDIEFTDTVTIRSYNVVDDSIITFNPNLFTNIENFPIGIFADPIFGTASSGVYAELTLLSSLPGFDDIANVLDSVVLVLPFNAKASYGNLDETYSLEVYRMAEAFPDTSLYSNKDYLLDKLIGVIDYIPMVNDSVIVNPPSDPDSIVKLAPQLRIPLTKNNFHTELFDIDTQYVSSASAFKEYFKGIYIKPVSTNKGMPSFDFRTNTTGIRVFYHRDSVYSEYLFPVFSTQVVTAKYDHDYSTSVLNLQADYIGESAPYRDSLLFLQGMSGINFVIEVPHAEYLADKLLNKAELIFPIQFLSQDDIQQYPPTDQILVSEIREDGSYRVIDDFIFARNRDFENFSRLFGGDVESDNTYRVNITTHLQDMSRGLVSKKMIVTLFLKAEQASRVVVSGPGNSAAPAKLEITYTNF